MNNRLLILWGYFIRLFWLRVQSQNIQIEIVTEIVNLRKAGTKNDNEARSTDSQLVFVHKVSNWAATTTTTTTNYYYYWRWLQVLLLLLATTTTSTTGNYHY